MARVAADEDPSAALPPMAPAPVRSPAWRGAPADPEPDCEAGVPVPDVGPGPPPPRATCTPMPPSAEGINTVLGAMVLQGADLTVEAAARVALQVYFIAPDGVLVCAR